MASYGDFVEFINSAGGERIAPPGKKFLYWNEGYTMLGKIIETVSHQKYSDYVGTQILKPLGMERSGFGEEAASGDGNAATFYLPSPDGKHRPMQLRSQELDIAAGGLISSTIELCKYLRMMLGGGAIGSRKIVSTALLKQAITGTVVDDLHGEFGEILYGYGWSVADDFLGHTLISHSGDVGISSAYVGFVPDSGVGVAVASNTGGGPNSAIGVYALACLLGGDPDKDIKSIAGEALAERVKGVYTDYRGYSSLTVTEWGAGYLKAEFKSNEMNYSIPIIVEGTELYTITNYHRSPVGIRMLAGRGVELLLERHRFIKE
jgi:CubicO group peptidase (beta-lactamase class C family)